MTNYIAVIHKDLDSDYGVSFPALPGCVTAGSTIQEAQKMALEALALHLDSDPKTLSITFLMETGISNGVMEAYQRSHESFHSLYRKLAE